MASWDFARAFIYSLNGARGSSSRVLICQGRAREGCRGVLCRGSLVECAGRFFNRASSCARVRPCETFLDYSGRAYYFYPGSCALKKGGILVPKAGDPCAVIRAETARQKAVREHGIAVAFDQRVMAGRAVRIFAFVTGNISKIHIFYSFLERQFARACQGFDRRGRQILELVLRREPGEK